MEKATKTVRLLGSDTILGWADMSLMQRLQIWKTYFYSKILYPLTILNLINKTSAKKITSQISMAFKSSLGFNKKLPKDIMYGWLEELTPQERSDLTILRILRKLKLTGMQCLNHKAFLDEIKTIPQRKRSKHKNKRNQDKSSNP